jgi:hypothetical protein
MFDKIFNVYHKAAKGNVLVVLLLSYILFVAFILRWAESQIKGFSGGTGPVDLLFNYSCDQAYQMLKSYNGEGREFYAIIELTADMVYPVIYSLFLSLLIIYLCRKLYIQERVTKVVFLLPVITLIADYFENICITVMLLNYPYKLNTVADAASIFTMIKWTFFMASSVLVLSGFLLLLVRFIKLKYKSSFKSKTVSR